MKKLLLLALLVTPWNYITADSVDHRAKKEVFYVDESYNAQPKKPWTFIVYMASDNDLFYFTKRNLGDMQKAGSNNNLNIVVQMDPTGIEGRTKRLYVTKDKIYQTNYNQPSSFEKQDVGNPQTLIDCCKWAIQNYPADNYALILWNHGSGILDSVGGKLSNATALFRFNPATAMLELDRSVSFLHFAQAREDKRGVCFSDTYGTFLTNQKLEYALAQVIQMLPKKKIDLVGFDACLMGMTEVANLLKPYAEIMVGSQEVELGTGWPYNTVLEPLTQKALSPREFGIHITRAFSGLYQPITQDYTLSCVDLTRINTLEKAINTVSTDLLDALMYQEYDSVYRALKAARAKNICTHFSEPSYIDFDHFLKNVYESIPRMTLHYTKQGIKDNLRNSINATRAAIKESVLSSINGRNVPNAKGLSIYFPLYFIDKTYYKTSFAQETKWLNVLQKAL